MESKPNKEKGSTPSVRVAVLLLAVMVLVFVAVLLFLRLGNDKEFRQHSEENVRRNLEALRKRETNIAHFYTNVGVDEDLDKFDNLPQIEEAIFELTDVTMTGLAKVRKWSNLNKLTLYGGTGGITDEALAQLAGHPKIETLILINTNVTDQGLKVLPTFPNLRSLRLYYDAQNPTQINAAGLDHLKSVSKLEQLTVYGRWAQLKSTAELQKMLPNCKINN
jgi:hypothetical protein